MKEWPVRPIERGPEKRTLTLEPGTYRTKLGFRSFGKFELEWFSGATDSESVRDFPVELDAENPLVQDFGRRLIDGLPSTNDSRFISELDRRYSALLPSAPLSREEQYTKLSDIVRAGDGTCAAKTMLLGVLLSRTFPKLQLSEIYGQVGSVREKVQYPFGHVWLRAESEEMIFLYDAMYSKTACFKKEGSELRDAGGAETFLNYSVEAYPLAALYNQLPVSSVDADMRVVDSYDGSSQKFFLNPHAGIQAQADGAMECSFSLDEVGELELTDMHLKTATSSGAALYYPVKSLARGG